METWKIQAFMAAFFAGLTAVLAKSGLENISSDLGLAIRTAFVFAFVVVNAFLWRGTSGFSELTVRQIGFLALSAATTALSWICYYRAMKTGAVSVVAQIDKASIVVTIVAACLFLREPITPRVISGAALIIAGLLVLTVRR